MLQYQKCLLGCFGLKMPKDHTRCIYHMQNSNLEEWMIILEILFLGFCYIAEQGYIFHSHLEIKLNYKFQNVFIKILIK